MTENIELHSFCVSTTHDSGIEEYHEINQESILDPVSPAYSVNNFKENDFFTEFDVKLVKKPGQRRTKAKHISTDQAQNLMDIISSELACVTVPISENSILMKEDVRNNSLVRVPSLLSMFGKAQPFCLNSEYGWRRKPTTKLSPIFPRILENAAPEHYFIPVQYIDPVSFDDFTLKNQADETDSKGKFLDITLNNIKFLYHHSFSLEKVLCAKLVETYDEYKLSQRTLEDLSRDMRVNRETRDKLRQEFIKISPKKMEDIRFDRTVRKYTCKVIKTKEQQKDVLKRQRRIIHEIISLWSDIEMIREKQGYAATIYHINIMTRGLDDKKLEETWNETYNVEFNDLLDKIEYDYVTKYLEYKELKQQYELGNAERKKLIKPKLQIDEDLLKEKVEKLVNSIVTKEEIEIFLNHEVSLLTHENRIELDTQHNYQFEFYVDNVFVCKSERYNSQKQLSFEIEFTESFSVQILTKNQTLLISLLEDDQEVSNLDFDLSKISQNYGQVDFIPQRFVYKNVLINPTTKRVGNGNTIKEIANKNKVRLKSSNIFVGNLLSTGEILLKIGWNENLNENWSEIVTKSMKVGSKLKRLIHGIERPNADLLGDIIAALYGKDINDDKKAMTTLRILCSSRINTETDFYIDENNPEYIRLKLLHLRNVGGFTNVENKLVPLHASQISTEQLNCLQNSKEKDIDVDYVNDKYADTDPIELQRFIGCKYIQKLNQKMLRNLYDHLLKKTHKDVVRDYRDLSLRNFFSNQSNLTTIASIPKSTKQQFLNESLGKEQEIQVTILRAYNLMNRSSTILSEDNGEDGSQIAGFKVRPLRPFVRLSYRGQLSQTATAIGCHPTWNQTLKIKTKLQPVSSLHINLFDEHKVNVNEAFSEDEHYSSKSSQHKGCSKWLGTLQVPLHAVLTTGMLRGTFKITMPPMLLGYEILQNKDTTYTLIPEVTQLLKKETSFITLQVSTSLSHLGALQGYNQPIPGSVDDDSLIKHLNTTVTEYTNDFPQRHISLTFIDTGGKNVCVTQYLQPIPLPDYGFFPKNPKTRVESALSKSSGLSKSSSSKSSGGRRKDVDVEKANQSPREEKESIYSGFEGSWKGESQLVKMMNAGLRFVALIPTYEVAESHVVSLTGLELLKVLYGSPQDHTILLASYFLYLGIKSWVVVGHGIPRGQSSFVLTKYDITSRRDVLVTDQLFKSKGFFNKGEGYLWNVYDATTGERYELRDVSCPLKTVDYVFDNENIWLNIQNSQDCESVSFDLTKSSNWMPVFDKTIFVPKQAWVTDSSLYSAPPDMTSLRELLEGKIRVKVQKWRSHLKTIWNRYCSSLLREVLPYWEYWTFNPSEQKPVLSQRLKQLMITYKLFGFPLNMPYVNFKSVISTVKSTAVHVNDDPNVEYGLAVEVYAYPNNVLSVWVFLASITRI